MRQDNLALKLLFSSLLNLLIVITQSHNMCDKLGKTVGILASHNQDSSNNSILIATRQVGSGKDNARKYQSWIGGEGAYLCLLPPLQGLSNPIRCDYRYHAVASIRVLRKIASGRNDVCDEVEINRSISLRFHDGGAVLLETIGKLRTISERSKKLKKLFIQKALYL